MKGALLVLRVVADVNFFNETYYIMTSCGKYISMLLLTVHCQILINYKDLSPVLSVLQRHFKIPFFSSSSDINVPLDLKSILFY